MQLNERPRDLTISRVEWSRAEQSKEEESERESPKGSEKKLVYYVMLCYAMFSSTIQCSGLLSSPVLPGSPIPHLPSTFPPQPSACASKQHARQAIRRSVNRHGDGGSRDHGRPWSRDADAEAEAKAKAKAASETAELSAGNRTEVKRDISSRKIEPGSTGWHITSYHIISCALL